MIERDCIPRDQSSAAAIDGDIDARAGGALAEGVSDANAGVGGCGGLPGACTVSMSCGNTGRLTRVPSGRRGHCRFGLPSDMKTRSGLAVHRHEGGKDSLAFILFAGGAAFSAYFAMYAFRKPFTAATYTDIADWQFAIDFKIALGKLLRYTLMTALLMGVPDAWWRAIGGPTSSG